MTEFDDEVSELSEQVDSILDTSSTSILVKKRSQVWDHFEPLHLNEKKRESVITVGELYYNNGLFLFFFFSIFTF